MVVGIVENIRPTPPVLVENSVEQTFELLLRKWDLLRRRPSCGISFCLDVVVVELPTGNFPMESVDVLPIVARPLS